MMILGEGTSSEMHVPRTYSSPRPFELRATHLGALLRALIPAGLRSQLRTADDTTDAPAPCGRTVFRAFARLAARDRGLQDQYLSHEAIQRDLHVRF